MAGGRRADSWWIAACPVWGVDLRKKPILDVEVPVALPPAAIMHLQMNPMMSAIDDAERGMALINMHWDVFDGGAERELFSSDWPLCVPNDAPWLGSPRSYVTVAITPTRLFVATGSVEKLAVIRDLSRRELEQRQNRATVQHASDFVGAASSRAEDFILRNFGMVERLLIMRGIAAKYGSQANS